MTDYCLILDLDQTLIFSTEKYHKDTSFDMKFSNNEFLYVYKRPGLDDFLKYCLENFKYVCVWSAGEDNYVKKIVQNIFKNQDKQPDFIWSRDMTESYYDTVTKDKVYYVKPLEKVYNYFDTLNPTNTIIYDDNETTAFSNLSNWIKSEPFSGDMKDGELYRLINLFNKYLYKGDDIRLLPVL